MRHTSIVVFLAAVLLALPAAAHRYIPNDGSHTTPEDALVIDDPHISQVVYHGLTAESSPLWIAIDTQAPYDLWVQFAAPVVGDEPDFRPTLAVIGPGLPAADLPFAMPEGSGAIVLDSANHTPEFFDEHFTGTQSWIFREEWIHLPEAGRYYLAAYHPTGEEGKLWVAVGKEESFTFADILLFPEIINAVRTFHEVVNEPMPPLPRAISNIARVVRCVLRLLGWPVPEFVP